MYQLRVIKNIWMHQENVVRDALYGQDSFATNKESQIRGTDSAVKLKFATVIRELSLPFPPYPGLDIFQDGWGSGPIVRVLCTASTIYQAPPSDEPTCGGKQEVAARQGVAQSIPELLGAKTEPLDLHANACDGERLNRGANKVVLTSRGTLRSRPASRSAS
jgi:hypothetical protein